MSRHTGEESIPGRQDETPKQAITRVYKVSGTKMTRRGHAGPGRRIGGSVDGVQC